MVQYDYIFYIESKKTRTIYRKLTHLIFERLEDSPFAVAFPKTRPINRHPDTLYSEISSERNDRGSILSFLFDKMSMHLSGNIYYERDEFILMLSEKIVDMGKKIKSLRGYRNFLNKKLRIAHNRIRRLKRWKNQRKKQTRKAFSVENPAKPITGMINLFN